MATEKPRFSVTFSSKTYEKIKEYQEKNNISTQSKAVAQLVEVAINEVEKGTKLQRSTFLSSGATKLADDYDNRLDSWGRQAIRDLMETEVARVEDEARFREDPAEDAEPKIINLFVEPSAAGIAVPTMGRDYEPYELQPNDPPGAAYAVRIQGDSMEPDFPDGSIVFINHDAMRDGEIGIFSVDGGTVCKQYHQEGGIVYLFSLNRRRSDADIVLVPGGNRSFVCQGRVITRKRYPVPGRG